ncbi:NrsF family protein, partial [Acinetobacter baumannii]
NLVDVLSHDFQKTRPLGSTLKIAALVAIVIAAGLFFAEIGFRPDITEAVGTVRFLFKFVVTLSLTITASIVAVRVGRPDGQIARKAS